MSDTIKIKLIKLSLVLKSNVIIRFICYPWQNLKRIIRQKRYFSSGEGEKIKKFRNLHTGERCFIIGNGPSLTINDLNLLKNEITFSANSIVHLLDKTDWKPTYYSCIDREVFLGLRDKIIESKLSTIFLADYVEKKFSTDSNRFYLNLYFPFTLTRAAVVEPFISEDLSKIVSSSYTVTFANIQLAFYMGFKEIYLIGVDHNYFSDSKKSSHAAGMPNLFVPKNIDKSLSVATKGYDVACQYADTHGIKIYNATRGGKLEVFTRVQFDDCFDEMELNGGNYES